LENTYPSLAVAVKVSLKSVSVISNSQMVPPAQSRVPELDETSPSAVTIRANLQPVTTVAMQQIKSVLVINAFMLTPSFYVQ
jgi:hypothetical protein